MAKERIFILEDEALIAEDIASVLRSLDYNVVGICDSGDQALDMIASLKPDLAILDINVNGTLNGIDIAKVIRAKYKFPYVYLTSYSDSTTLDLVKPTMPYGYIVKPFTDSGLKSNVELALFKFSQEQEELFPTLEQLNKSLSIQLTQREYDVFILMYEGLSYQQIADKIFLSINTVKSYQKALFAKLKVKNRSEAVRKALA